MMGERLKETRLKRNLTQKELSDRVGITQAMLSMIEDGLRIPSVAILAVLCRELDVSMDYIAGGASASDVKSVEE